MCLLCVCVCRWEGEYEGVDEARWVCCAIFSVNAYSLNGGWLEKDHTLVLGS